MEQLSFLFNEAVVFSDAEKEEAENVTVVAAHKRHKKHEYTLDKASRKICPRNGWNTAGGRGPGMPPVRRYNDRDRD